jgi:tRNA uridine 5-carbamoylmethylation protein Kti12
MRLIFIYGMPATGKLTVAQELAKTIRACAARSRQQRSPGFDGAKSI